MQIAISTTLLEKLKLACSRFTGGLYDVRRRSASYTRVPVDKAYFLEVVIRRTTYDVAGIVVDSNLLIQRNTQITKTQMTVIVEAMVKAGIK